MHNESKLDRWNNQRTRKRKENKRTERERENLFAVALREVDDVGPSRRQVHQRAGASLPQLRIYHALLLSATCCHVQHRSLSDRRSFFSRHFPVVSRESETDRPKRKQSQSCKSLHRKLRRERERERVPSHGLAAAAADEAPAPLAGVFITYFPTTLLPLLFTWGGQEPNRLAIPQCLLHIPVLDHLRRESTQPRPTAALQPAAKRVSFFFSLPAHTNRRTQHGSTRNGEGKFPRQARVELRDQAREKLPRENFHGTGGGGAGGGGTAEKKA